MAIKRSILSIIFIFSLVSLFAQEHQTVKIHIPFKNFQELLASESALVGLPYTEFDRILKTIEAADKEKLERKLNGYALVKSSYHGVFLNKGFQFKASLKYILKGDKFKKIPLFFSDISMTSLKNSKGENLSLVPPENISRPYSFITRQSGEVEFEIDFFVEVKDKYPRGFSFQVPLCPITTLKLSHPEPNMEFQCPEARVFKEGKTAVDNVFLAYLSPTRRIRVNFQERVKTIEPVKREVEKRLAPQKARVYMESLNFGMVSDGLCQVQSRIFFEIHQGELESLTFNIPKNALILDLEGKRKVHWKVLDKKKSEQLYQTILVELLGRMTGKFFLNLSYEVAFEVKDKKFIVPIPKNEDYTRNSGMIALGTSENAELRALNFRNLKQADIADFQSRWDRLGNIKDFESNLDANASKHLVLAYSFSSEDAELELSFQRHEEVRVMTTAIDNCYALTLLTRDGHLVNQLVYRIRNSNQQFLQVLLAEGEKLWSVKVNGKPVKTGKDKEGRLQIPLIKSPRTNQQLLAFPVELTYYQKCAPLRRSLGGIELKLPKMFLRISSLEWRTYIPVEYKLYSIAKSNVLRREGRFSFSPPGSLNNATSPYSSQNRLNQMDPIEARQLDSILDSFKRGGVLPVKIKLPGTDNYYQFHKDLLESDKPQPFVRVRYCGLVFLETLKVCLFIAGFFFVLGLFRIIFIQFSISLGSLLFILGLIVYLVIIELAIPTQYFVHGLFLAILAHIIYLLLRFLTPELPAETTST
ncbi:hypothetical protein ACFL35_18945 [Candidatus Riflebacteria bacterium]